MSSSYDPYNSYRGPTERECLTDSHLVSCYGDCIKEVYYSKFSAFINSLSRLVAAF